MNRLIDLLEEIVGLKATVSYIACRPGDVRHSLADITLARRLLGYEPKVMIKEGLIRTVKSFELALWNR